MRRLDRTGLLLLTKGTLGHVLPVHWHDSILSLSSEFIKSKLLVLGEFKTTINDQGCQHVTGRFESIRMFVSKQTAWPTFVQAHPSVKTEQ